MPKKLKYSKIKNSMIYTTKELAEEVEGSLGAIQRLINEENLPVVDKTQKPYYIMGEDAKEFFKTKYKKNKLKLKPFEFRCMHCQKAVISVPSNFDFKILNVKLGNTARRTYAKGICSVCGTKLNKFTSDKRIESQINFYSDLQNKQNKQDVAESIVSVTDILT